jgi:4-amino-4-deoxy-L-arabinose transferase-like glycosyltransferase
LKFRDLLILLVLCVLVFWVRLGRIGLIDPDEPFYAVTAQEMIQGNDWVTPKIFGQPQFEKPILYYWMVAASFKVFGTHEWAEFAGRLPSALPATLLVFLVYGFTARVFNRRTGLLAGVVLASGLEYAIMSRLMLTDIVLALFIAGSLYCYWLAIEDEARRSRWVLLHFVFGGLAALTKGPVGLVVSLLTTATFSLVTKRAHPYRGRAFWTGVGAYLFIAAPWYAVMLAKYGWAYFDAFVVHENIMRFFYAEHHANNHFWYYIAVLAGGSIPWLPALVLACSRAWRGGIRRDARLVFLWSWLLTSFVFLTVTQSKLPSYIFFVFVPLAQVIAVALDELWSKGFRDTAERVTVISLSVLQIGIGVAARFIKTARPFEIPALLFAGCLAVGLIFVLRSRIGGWIAANAAATIALVVGALTFSAEHVEAYSSARPVAEKMMQMRKGNEPLIAGIFLVRGIHFYTHDLTHQPVAVVGLTDKPFKWTQHDKLRVIAGANDGYKPPGADRNNNLGVFLKEKGAAICTLRRSEWDAYWQQFKWWDDANPPVWSGDNVIVRLVGKEP